MQKLFARGKDDNKVLLKMGFLGDLKKKKLRMKDGKNWNYLKIKI